MRQAVVERLLIVVVAAAVSTASAAVSVSIAACRFCRFEAVASLVILTVVAPVLLRREGHHSVKVWRADRVVVGAIRVEDLFEEGPAVGS